MKTCEEIVKLLEQNAPDIYIQCRAAFPDERGRRYEKKYTLNLKTGDVFKARSIFRHERPNHKLNYRQKNFQARPYEYAQTAFAFRNAQIIENKLVLATWVFAQGVLRPVGLDSIVNITRAEIGYKQDSDAVTNIRLPRPQIAAMVTISRDRVIEQWENVEDCGFWNSVGGNLRNTNQLAKHLYDGVFINDAAGFEVNNLFSCFKDFFGNECASLVRYHDFRTFGEIRSFMKEPLARVGFGKNNEQLKSLTSILLPTHDIAEDSEEAVCYADRVNDCWSVLRWWRKTHCGDRIESARIYANDSVTIPCVSDRIGNWICSDKPFHETIFNAHVVNMTTNDVFDNTMLAYTKDLLPMMTNQGKAMYMCTIHPEFEKLYKIGLSWICNEFVDGNNWNRYHYQRQSWNEYLLHIVGHVNDGESSPLKMVGINRHQMNSLNDFIVRVPKNHGVGYRNIDIIYLLKRMFNVKTLSGIDNKTFDYILSTINTERLRDDAYVNVVSSIFRAHPANALVLVNNMNMAISNCECLQDFDERPISRTDMYVRCGDIIRMIQEGHREDVIKPRFASVKEIIETHDLLVELANAEAIKKEEERSEQYRGGFATNYKRWKQWEWSGNKDYCVVAPQEPIDIAKEGIVLRHCVRTYISAVANGDTNIMFIRRKKAKDKPFFTVEISNEGNIRQVHGACNSNTDSVEGLTEFVCKWAKRNNFNYYACEANGTYAVE